jgi:hypothetical protein
MQKSPPTRVRIMAHVYPGRPETVSQPRCSFTRRSGTNRSGRQQLRKCKISIISGFPQAKEQHRFRWYDSWFCAGSRFIPRDRNVALSLDHECSCGYFLAALAASTFAAASAYFFVKRSTRPAVSISFCLPVKKGWQFEQISTRNISPLMVERVGKVLPQAQCTVTW